jgi:DNA polymerase-3 subunit epsilon
MILATQYLLHERHKMPSFRLSRVAKHLGIEVLDENLHNAQYDIDITMQIYHKVKGKTIDDW